MFRWFKSFVEEHTKQCDFTWSTRPSNPIPGAHYDHSCVNDPGDVSRCNGPHICRNWHCNQSHS